MLLKGRKRLDVGATNLTGSVLLHMVNSLIRDGSIDDSYEELRVFLSFFSTSGPRASLVPSIEKNIMACGESEFARFHTRYPIRVMVVVHRWALGEFRKRILLPDIDNSEAAQVQLASAREVSASFCADPAYCWIPSLPSCCHSVSLPPSGCMVRVK